MSYTTRGLEWGEEGTFGTEMDPTNAINYLIDWDITTTPGIDEQETAGGDRDAVARALLGKECAGRFSAKFLSPKILYYALGSLTAGGSVGADAKAITDYTISPCAVLPSLTFMRGCDPPTNVGRYYGAKIDSAVLNLAVGEAVTYEINFVAANSTLYTTGYTVPTVSFTLEPYSFVHGKAMKAGATLIPDLQACVVEINNNLVGRFSAHQGSGDPRAASSIKEGRLAVTGRFTTGDTIEPTIIQALESLKFDLDLILQGKNTGESIEVKCNDVIVTEWADTGSGRDPYETEFPFLAAPTSGLDIIEIRRYGSDWDSDTA